ncbi:AbrB/MazE/SpoVT family DNA-binding domain-containing protein [Candidatus Saganbacteria bacterium]|nr:AbrB/MazE/SpoVT family DNA-binding domain-containing protein [Candidatus Saganbacteria bacterium]
MTKITVKKGYLILIPPTIRKEIEIKEGDSLIIESLGEKTIILEKPRSKDPFEECKGMWKNKKESLFAVNYVNKIRKGSNRFDHKNR